jgi:hypothetical protein
MSVVSVQSAMYVFFLPWFHDLRYFVQELREWLWMVLFPLLLLIIIITNNNSNIKFIIIIIINRDNVA